MDDLGIARLDRRLLGALGGGLEDAYAEPLATDAIRTVPACAAPAVIAAAIAAVVRIVPDMLVIPPL